MRAPKLEQGERVLGRIITVPGNDVIVTDRAIYHQDGVWARLGWEQIERCEWDERRHRLRLTGVTRHITPMVLRLANGSALISVVRERIRWTNLLTTDIEIDGLGPARVTIRRDPGDGALLWVVQLRHDVDTAHTRLEAMIDAAIGRLARQLGLDHL